MNIIKIYAWPDSAAAPNETVTAASTVAASDVVHGWCCIYEGQWFRAKTIGELQAAIRRYRQMWWVT